ncbi:MAG: ABC transporter permease [Cyclobacteriaceae bacterium]
MEDWLEIIESLRKNKLRTFLTGFSVAWGIFILVILVGTSKGLKGGATSMFGNDLSNTLFIRPGSTSIPFNGIKPGKKIKFINEDIDIINREIEDIEYYTARLFFNKNQVNYKKQHGSYTIRCVHPGNKIIESSDMLQGRFINEKDLQEYSKIAVIGISIKEALFVNDEDPIGKYIIINQIPFKVVGVFTDTSEEDEQRMIYLPITGAQKSFSFGEKISQIVVTVKNPSLEKSERIIKKIRKLLSPTHNFDPEDRRSLFINNRLKQSQQIFDMLDGLQLFTTIISILTIIAGAIGVMNIMVISVKERTKEIGIRKAIGASPNSIISSIIKEAIFITLFFGYIGMLGAVILLEVLNKALSNTPIFSEARIDLSTALIATGILTIVGVFAGLIPAAKAAKIKPVEALNS